MDVTSYISVFHRFVKKRDKGFGSLCLKEYIQENILKEEFN